MPPRDLRERTKRFAVAIVALTRLVSGSHHGRVIAGQLLRSGTSVAANYRAARRARSRKEFVARLGVAEEEADESAFWLELLLDTGLSEPAPVKDLLAEADALTAIMVASIRTARSHGSKK